MGFQNEKDHPEVAPSQFEINYSYAEVVAAADHIQLYKLICRQVATKMGMTASFLPKPVVGVNGSGMHTNVSITKDGKNLFWDPNGEEKISTFAWELCGPHSHRRQRYLPAAECQRERLSPPGSALRSAQPDHRFGGRPRFHGPHSDRQRAQRSRLKSARSVRTRIRTLVLYSVFKTGLEGTISKMKNLRSAKRYLPDNIYDAMDNFNKSAWTTTLLGEDVKGRYAELKKASADRCARLLGTIVKTQPKFSSITKSTISSCGTSSKLRFNPERAGFSRPFFCVRIYPFHVLPAPRAAS